MVEVKERFEKFFEKSNGCWDWTGSTVKGYGQFAHPQTTLAHRASYLIYNGDFDLRLQVLHKCDNPLCVNPDHLFVGAAQDNMDDKMSKGRHCCPSGGDHPLSQLTSDDVVYIRELYKSKQYSLTLIASEFNIGVSALKELSLE